MLERLESKGNVVVSSDHHGDVTQAGHLEWQDATRSRCLVMWRTPEEWGDILYQWVRLCR